MKRILILLGVPGSGKGTQAKLLLKRIDYGHISTGDLLRALAENPDADPEDVQALADMKAGKLVADELIFKLAFAEMDRYLDAEKGVILDGAIRSVEQAKRYQKYFVDKGLREEVMAIELRISDETTRKRIQDRIEKGNGRPDDFNEEVIKKRIEEQGNAALAPITAYYEQEGVLVVIDGEQSIEAVDDDVMEVLRKTS